LRVTVRVRVKVRVWVRVVVEVRARAKVIGRGFIRQFLLRRCRLRSTG